MKIRCKLERANGTQLTLDQTDYNFQPNAAGAHVCEVTDKEHIARLLSIPEAYELYDPTAPVVRELPAVTPPSTVAPTPSVVDYTKFTRKRLDKAYKDKFGKKPSERAKNATIIAALTGASNG